MGNGLREKFKRIDNEVALLLLESAAAIKPVSGNFDWMAKYSSRYDLLQNECRRIIQSGEECRQHQSKNIHVGPFQFIPRMLDQFV